MFSSRISDGYLPVPWYMRIARTPTNDGKRGAGTLLHVVSRGQLRLELLLLGGIIVVPTTV